jgi:hypothetical protein
MAIVAAKVNPEQNHQVFADSCQLPGQFVGCQK